MIVRLTPAAKQDLRETLRWYRHGKSGLDLEFKRSLEACLAGVRRTPKAYLSVHRDVRRALLHRFPYAVFFVLKSDSIVVIACLHGARDPGTWMRRRSQ